MRILLRDSRPRNPRRRWIKVLNEPPSSVLMISTLQGSLKQSIMLYNEVAESNNNASCYPTSVSNYLTLAFRQTTSTIL